MPGKKTPGIETVRLSKYIPIQEFIKRFSDPISLKDAEKFPKFIGVDIYISPEDQFVRYCLDYNELLKGVDKHQRDIVFYGLVDVLEALQYFSPYEREYVLDYMVKNFDQTLFLEAVEKLAERYENHRKLWRKANPKKSYKKDMGLDSQYLDQLISVVEKLSLR